MKSLLALALLSTSVFAADIDKRPPAFGFRNAQATFVDIKQATYDIAYNIETKTVAVVAHLEVTTIENGHPIFDSVQEPTSVRIDGREVGATLTATPDKKTFVRVVNESVKAGDHLIEVELPMKEYIQWADKAVSQSLFMGDLNDREYMERHLPSNFQFDRYPITYNIDFGSADNQKIYANGKVTRVATNQFTVEYSAQYNNSCPYFQTVPEGTYMERHFTFKSISGKDIPVLVYAPKIYTTADFDRWQDMSLTIMAELEKDYGPYLHPSLMMLITSGNGGMEYSGALTAGEKSIGHEILHSYFARGVIPAEGNSGWIDEAIARWRDNGYPRLEKLDGKSNIAALGTYNRLTDRRSYAFGSQVMAYFDGKFKDKGGLKPFLKKLAQEKSFNPITTEDFIRDMNAFYGVDNRADFKRLVMDGTAISKMMVEEQHHNHTHEELMRVISIR